MDKTTILVEKTTRDVLKRLGNKGQSYDNLINWLISIKTRQINGRKNNSLDYRFASHESSELS